MDNAIYSIGEYTIPKESRKNREEYQAGESVENAHFPASNKQSPRNRLLQSRSCRAADRRQLYRIGSGKNFLEYRQQLGVQQLVAAGNARAV